MNDELSDLRRVLSSSGVYAVAAVAQRGLAFFLLPVYTYYIDPSEYGVLELLTAFSTIVFGCLMMGLPSAIMKCYHRDCETPEDQAKILSTAIWLDLPVLLAGAVVLFAFSSKVGAILLGRPSDGSLVRLVVVTGCLTSLMALTLTSLRTRERAIAFSILSLIQFIGALSLNIVLVVHYGLGIRGVLWGNLVSNLIALPVALAVATRGARLAPSPRLIRPMLRFGWLLTPVVLSGWIINSSDRYVLRLFTDLEEIAVYGVGYKFGFILELLVVMPFQLAWPAVSFSISKRDGHRETFARTLTYLLVVMTFLYLAVSILTRVLLLGLVGEGYREAYRVVPLVALAYALNGIQYCISPGVHISEKTRYLTLISMAAAALNLILNFLLIPRWGMMGAAWATAWAFLLIAACTVAVAQKFYKVSYDYGRVGRVAVLGAVILFLGTKVPPEPSAFSITWHIIMGVVAFPIGLELIGFLNEQERSALRLLSQRYLGFLVR